MAEAGRAAAIPAEQAGTVLTLDLRALVGNWRRLAEEAGRAECAAVLKANAYGQGLEAVAGALARAGCRTFFVAHVFEGRALRALAPDATIYILNGLLPGTAPLYAEARLRPVLNCLPELAEWREAVGSRLPCAIQVETGMNRVGLAAEDLAAAADLAAELDVGLVASHLIWSSPARAAETADQIARFETMRAAWPDVPASLANSSGVFSQHRPHYDLVRPGYALFGGNPTPGRSNAMTEVARMEARVLQVHAVAAGGSVGYDSRWSAAAPRRLATISAGYADGIPFGAAGVTDRAPGGWAVVAGVPCPMVGRVSMDLIVLDVTDAPSISRGDAVTLLGDGITIDDLAGRAGTIGYEVLTKLGLRSHRRVVGG